jgi:hypothetical protein
VFVAPIVLGVLGEVSDAKAVTYVVTEFTFIAARALDAGGVLFATPLTLIIAKHPLVDFVSLSVKLYASTMTEVIFETSCVGDHLAAWKEQRAMPIVLITLEVSTIELTFFFHVTFWLKVKYALAMTLTITIGFALIPFFCFKF